jgi:hypothetical protein
MVGYPTGVWLAWANTPTVVLSTVLAFFFGTS